jgi:hypothetical protein
MTSRAPQAHGVADGQRRVPPSFIDEPLNRGRVHPRRGQLESSRVTLPGGDSFEFEIDPFARTMILAGTDEIGYVLGRLPAI